MPNFVDIGGRYDDDLRCRQWRNDWYHDNSRFPVSSVQRQMRLYNNTVWNRYIFVLTRFLLPTAPQVVILILSDTSSYENVVHMMTLQFQFKNIAW